MEKTRNQVNRDNYKALTKKQAELFRRFGVSVDEQGRVCVATPAGCEVMVDSGQHKVFVMGAQFSGRTMIAAHGYDNFCKTVACAGPQNEKHVALATITTERV